MLLSLSFGERIEDSLEILVNVDIWAPVWEDV